MDRFTAGDPLRGLATLSIIISHAANTVLHSRGVPVEAVRSVAPETFGWMAMPLLYTGGVGLALFFALSGYLIGRPFVRAFLAGTSVPPIGPYLANRLLRIVPAFWVTVTLTLILFQPGGSLADAAAVYLFVQNYWPSDIARFVEHAWSIDVEVGFYLLMPAVAVLLTWLARTLSGARARLLILLYLLLAGIALGEFLILSEAPGSGALRTVLSWLPFLLLGLVLATIEPTAVARLRGRERAGAPAIALLAGAVLFCALHLRFSLGDRPSPEGSVVTLFVGAGWLIAAPLVLQWGERPCWRALDNRALRWIGERSYSMYLLHVIPILLLAPLVASLASGSPWDMLLGLLALELAILLPAAALSYRFVERPFLALKRRRVAGSLRPMSGRPRSARAQSGDRRASDSATQS